MYEPSQLYWLTELIRSIPDVVQVLSKFILKEASKSLYPCSEQCWGHVVTPHGVWVGLWEGHLEPRQCQRGLSAGHVQVSVARHAEPWQRCCGQRGLHRWLPPHPSHGHLFSHQGDPANLCLAFIFTHNRLRTLPLLCFTPGFLELINANISIFLII